MTDARAAVVLAVKNAIGYLGKHPEIVYRFAYKTLGAFDRQLWSYALDFYRGDTDISGFIDSFTASIDNQLTRAWNEGAREVNVQPEDMTEEDLMRLEGIINSEYDHILDLASAIDQARTDGKTLDEFRQSFRARIDLWVNRYTETANDAKMYFGGRQKLVWRLGATEEHCETCAQLDGIVAYADEWEQSGLHPQEPPNIFLECAGWRCDCKLEVTDERRTARALDRLTEIAVSKNV